MCDADTSATCLATSAVLGSDTTDPSGRVSLLPNAGCSGLVMIAVIANAGTVYFDECVNAFVATAPEGTSMRVLLPSLSGATTLSIGMTPPAEIATRQAIAAASGNAANVNINQVLAANGTVVSQVFGGTVTFDILAEPALFISQPASGNLGAACRTKSTEASHAPILSSSPGRAVNSLPSVRAAQLATT